MIERYLKHMLKYKFDKEVKSLKINSKHEFIADSTDDTVFYTIDFSFTDVIAHNHCTCTMRVDFHDYETECEMYVDYLQICITYK